jgi:hypothetical protein
MNAVTSMCAFTDVGGVFGTIFLVAYLAIIIYLISLLGRLVKAIEKIAAKIENSPKI